jgi:hypothetical protein
MHPISVLTGLVLILSARDAALPEAWDYTGPMKKIAVKFRGNEASSCTLAVR